MLNQVAVEALYSATYVENYLDFVENLPDDVQRHLSRIRDIDVQYRSHLRDVDALYEQLKEVLNASTNNPTKRARYVNRIQQGLISAQELGDEKMQIVNHLQELIEQKTRQLDIDHKNLDYGKEDRTHNESSTKIPCAQSPILSAASSGKTETINSNASTLPIQELGSPASQSGDKIVTSSCANSTNSGDQRPSKRVRRARNDNTSSLDVANNESNSMSDIASLRQSNTNQALMGGSGGGGSYQKKTNAQNMGKKKRRKMRGQSTSSTNLRDIREDTPQPDPIDPDEPTYCLCDQISFGEMILCDNDLCPIEWFHFSCVALTSKPKGKWYCPNCRGDRPNVMKPKAQFLKELERYNKEKEEKT